MIDGTTVQGNHGLCVQLLFFDGCPLAEAARRSLETALADCGISDYERIDILAPSVADDLRGWGSPTILVNGVDVSGHPKGDAIGCRIYPGADGVPSASTIGAYIRSVEDAH